MRSRYFLMGLFLLVFSFPIIHIWLKENSNTRKVHKYKLWIEKSTGSEDTVFFETSTKSKFLVIRFDEGSDLYKIESNGVYQKIKPNVIDVRVLACDTIK